MTRVRSAHLGERDADVIGLDGGGTGDVRCEVGEVWVITRLSRHHQLHGHVAGGAEPVSGRAVGGGSGGGGGEGA
eukprot:scaffold11779_cov31-Phaeocystis_antarctica.AAC.1